MGFIVASYNIQFGFGIDGRYDLERIADAVRGAGIILLQEVTRGFSRNDNADMVAAIRAALPDFHAAAHLPADIFTGFATVDGRIEDSRFQFGNMVLSRWPLVATRSHALPRVRRTEKLNLQRGALEALVVTPAGPVRVVSTHLDHIDASERLRQIAAIRTIMADPEGPGASGLGEFGFPELPQTGDVLVMGDFNMRPGSPEYAAMTGGGATVDLSPPGDIMSFFNPAEPEPLQRLDYAFATPALAARVTGSRIDEAATGSDHRPLFVEIG